MNERRELTFEMKVKEIFKLADGRTIIVGAIDGGDDVILLRGASQLSQHGHRIAEVKIEPEMFGLRRGAPELFAVSTTDPIELTASDVATGQYVLTGKKRMTSHRHLVGIDSPPNDFVPDRMTLGPRLPEGWDGDSWTSPDESAFFLRAWNKATARYATGTGANYADAKAALLAEIKSGGRAVVIAVREGAT